MAGRKHTATSKPPASPNNSPAHVLDKLLDNAAGGLTESPWVQQRLMTFLEKLCEELTDKFKLDEEGDNILFAALSGLANSYFLAGFDYCLEPQKALRAFADGHPEVLRPFIPTPYDLRTEKGRELAGLSEKTQPSA